MALVKICGIKSAEMVAVAAAAGADWIGLNLVPESPRSILSEGPGASARLYDLLFAAADANIRTVALVSDADQRTWNILASAVQPDVIQLHGRESPEFVRSLRENKAPSVEIWKAIGVSEAADLDACAAYEDADRFLIDAKPPDGATYSGGHGNTFDWSILKNWEAPKPWLLAGGLTSENVQAAITATGATAVDVSSGVERERGVKDAALIEQFIKAAKEA